MMDENDVQWMMKITLDVGYGLIKRAGWCSGTGANADRGNGRAVVDGKWRRMGG